MRFRTAAALALPLSLASLGCQAPPRTEFTTHVLTIALKPNGCPAKVEHGPIGNCGWSHLGKLCVLKGDKLQWVGEKPFELYFDPFADPVKATSSGGRWQTEALEPKASSPPRDEGEVEYKYTVVVDDCRKPLDPPIFIQR